MYSVFTTEEIKVLPWKYMHARLKLLSSGWTPTSPVDLPWTKGKKTQWQVQNYCSSLLSPGSKLSSTKNYIGTCNGTDKPVEIVEATCVPVDLQVFPSKWAPGHPKLTRKDRDGLKTCIWQYLSQFLSDLDDLGLILKLADRRIQARNMKKLPRLLQHQIVKAGHQLQVALTCPNQN